MVFAPSQLGTFTLLECLDVLFGTLFDKVVHQFFCILQWEWKQLHQYFFAHASGSLLWISRVVKAFRSERETTLCYLLLSALDRPLDGSGRNFCRGPGTLHPYKGTFSLGGLYFLLL